MIPDFDADAAYAGVVYDLDGTLVRLDVDWDAVAADVAAVYRDADATPPDDLWAMLDRSSAFGIGDAVEATIAAHERAGARTAERLPLADELAALDRPAGVCSLNCEAACHVALSAQSLDECVDAVIGRDSVPTRKPDPGPLLETVRRLSLAPESVVFVGDSDRDAEAARRAGTAFRRVE